MSGQHLVSLSNLHSIKSYRLSLCDSLQHHRGSHCFHSWTEKMHHYLKCNISRETDCKIKITKYNMADFIWVYEEFCAIVITVIRSTARMKTENQIYIADLESYASLSFPSIMSGVCFR